MIEQIATVVAVHDGDAEVVTTRQTACNSCSAKRGCGTSLLSTWFPQRQLRFRLRNPIGAAPGDTVVVGLDESTMQVASMSLYGLPVVGLLLGAVVGEILAPKLLLHPELGAILGGLCGLIGALALVRQASSNKAESGREEVRLLRVARQTVSFPLSRTAVDQPEEFRNS